MLLLIQEFLILLLILSLFIYFILTVKEKIYLKKNIILIENKFLTREDLEKVDINEFVFKGKRVKSGDEIKVITLKNEKVNGTLIGGNKKDRAIHIITFDNKIKKLKIDTIIKFRIISKYGKFLNH